MLAFLAACLRAFSGQRLTYLNENEINIDGNINEETSPDFRESRNTIDLS